MKDQLVGFVIGRLAIIAGNVDGHARREQRSLQRLDPGDDRLADIDRVGAIALGDGDRHRRGRGPTGLGVLCPAPTACLILGCALYHLRDITQLHRRAAGRTNRQRAHFISAGQRAAGRHCHRSAIFAHRAPRKATPCLTDRVHHRRQRHPLRREASGIGDHADGILLATGYEGDADIIDFGDFTAQLGRQIVKRAVIPLPDRAGLWCQRQNHDRHIGDAAGGDLWRGDADRNLVGVGLDLLVDAGGGGFGAGPDDKPRGHQHAIVLRLGIDVLDAIDRFDDGFERLGGQLDGIGRRQAGRGHVDIDHRHADLRLFLARDGDCGDQPDHDRRQQEQRC